MFLRYLKPVAVGTALGTSVVANGIFAHRLKAEAHKSNELRNQVKDANDKMESLKKQKDAQKDASDRKIADLSKALHIQKAETEVVSVGAFVIGAAATGAIAYVLK